MRPCLAITKRSGEACPNPAGSSGYCFSHDPELAAERAAARRRGGLRKTARHGGDPLTIPGEIRSLSGVLALLDYTRSELVSMDNGIPRSRALIALCAAYIEAIKTGELENRIMALETIFKAREAKR